MTEQKQLDGSTLPILNIASEIIASYVSHNSMRSADLADLIAVVHSTVTLLANGQSEPKPEEPQQPAVSVKKSITPDFLICLEDGKQFKSMKRHLGTVYNMTPDQYREKWKLPKDYPMVAPAYAAARSALAKESGLGRQASATNAKGAAVTKAASKGRGRPRKDAA